MKTLIFVNSINNYSNPLIVSAPNFLNRFPSLSAETKNNKFPHICRSKWLYSPRTLKFSPIKAVSSADSSGYGGWDVLRLGGDTVNSGESTHLRDFLVSVGIDDKKHVFTFILGLVCAFSISRVRISSIVVFPATILVFAIGFSFGFVRGGSFSEVSGGKRRSKEEIYRVDSEKLRGLLDFFYGFEGKVGGLKSDIRSAIDCNKVTVNDLENYFNVLESINLSASNARNAVETCIVNVGNSNNMLAENKKSSKKRKENGEVAIDWLQFIVGLFGEKVVNPKPNKVKDNIKEGTAENVASDQNQGNNSSPVDEERFIDYVNDSKGIGNSHFSRDSSNKFALDQDGNRRIKMGLQDEKMSLGQMSASARGFMGRDEYSYQSNRLQFINNHHVSLNMGHTDEIKTWESHDNLLDSVDFRVSWKHMESEASFLQESMLKKSTGAYRSSGDREKGENETYGSRLREEKLNTKDDSHLDDQLSAHGSEVGSSSSAFTDDVVFNRYLMEANDLLKRAKECTRSDWDEELAEKMLHNSAELLSNAIAMKPLSLLAVGQLGNTYLLHGELKLRVSRRLRRLLLQSDIMSVEKEKRVLKGLDYQLASKEKIASLLVDACEECEELLVKAGRKYRLALSIDGNDVRALYNWGLALSFRAQLIADIGPVRIPT